MRVSLTIKGKMSISCYKCELKNRILGSQKQEECRFLLFSGKPLLRHAHRHIQLSFPRRDKGFQAISKLLMIGRSKVTSKQEPTSEVSRGISGHE